MPIAVVSIPVADQDAAIRFYVETLGFTLLHDVPMGPEMRWVQLQPRDGGASVALTTWFNSMQPGGLQGLLIHVPDIDVERERLVQAGVAASPVETQDWGRFTMFADPDGNGLIFATLTADEAAATR